MIYIILKQSTLGQFCGHNSDKGKKMLSKKMLLSLEVEGKPTVNPNNPFSISTSIMPASTPIHSTFNCTLQQHPPPSPPPTTLSTTAKPKSILDKHPLYTQTQTNVSLQFKEKILCLEILGIDSGKALSHNPSLHSASLDSIQTIISYLQSKGISQKDLPRIFGMCPQILTSDIQTELNPVFIFLSNYLGVSESNFRKVINKCPRLLICSVKDQLKPALFYLQRLGFKDLDGLAYNDPILLVSNVEKTLIPKLEFLVSLGFTKQEVIEMVLRCPGLFTFSIEKNYKPKLDYFLGEMKGKLEDLKDFPQYFAFSLENRIKPRHLEAVKNGINVALPLLLKTTDEEFRQLISQGTA